MAKLLKSNLKNWLTLSDAAIFLNSQFEETIEVSDVLQFGCDSNLTLSILISESEIAIPYSFICNIKDAENFRFELIDVNLFLTHTTLLLESHKKQNQKNFDPKSYIIDTYGIDIFEIISPYIFRDVPFKLMEVIEIDSEEKKDFLIKNLPINSSTLRNIILLPNGDLFKLTSLKNDSGYIKINGIFDLAMIGNEKLDIENILFQLKGLQAPKLTCLEGFFIRNKNYLYCIHASSKDRNGELWHYPAGGITEFGAADFICTTNNLNKFINEISNPLIAQELDIRERNSLLLIIAGLCKKAGIDTNKRGVSKIVKLELEEMGVSISEDTIKKYIDQVSDVVSDKSL